MTRKTLREAVDLLNEVFPDKEEEPPSEELPASLCPQKSYIKYWVVIDDLGQVVGTVGLYCDEKDGDEAFWLGWFCVRPDLRKNGIGTKLLLFAIRKAKKEGKKFIRLYTSTESNELNAHRLYEKHRFKLTGREPYPDSEIEKLYYELKL